MMQNGRQSGFTLIELVIVLAIMAVMTALALPSITRYRMTEATKSGAATIASALREGRSRALRENQQYVVVLNPDISITPPPAGAGYPYPGANQGVLVAHIVRDSDGDGRESNGDNLVINVTVPTDTLGVRPLDPAVDTRFNNAREPRPNPTGRRLSAALGGNTFFQTQTVGTYLNTPKRRTAVVVFNGRGIPLDPSTLRMMSGTTIGTASYYVTDGFTSVYAATLNPLGEIRLQTLDINQLAAGDPWR